MREDTVMATELDACRERLISVVSSIIAQSGSLEDFDPASWVDRWLCEPLPALGTTPREYILAGRDCEVVLSLLRQAQSGSFS